MLNGSIINCPFQCIDLTKLRNKNTSSSTVYQNVCTKMGTVDMHSWNIEVPRILPDDVAAIT